MKKLIFPIIFLLILTLSGCKEYGDKRIVKLISIEDDKISLYYYDYSKEEQSYLKEEKEYTDIIDDMTSILSENDYDLKLCKYAVVSSSILKDRADFIFDALTYSKFSPDISIIEADENISEITDYLSKDSSGYPLYTYSLNEDSVTGVIEDISTRQKNLIIKGKFYRKLSYGESFVFDIINKKLEEGIYIFEHNDDILSVELDNIMISYSFRKNILDMNVSAILKGYKGARPTEKERKQVIKLAENSMKNATKSLINDMHIVDNFNIILYKKVADIEKININFHIK